MIKDPEYKSITMKTTVYDRLLASKETLLDGKNVAVTPAGLIELLLDEHDESNTDPEEEN